MKKNRAIIFAHNGSQDYFKLVLHQSIFINPEEKIIVIGNADPRIKGVSFIDVSSLYKFSDHFRSSFISMSTYSIEYDIFCFVRWIHIYYVMKLENLTEVWVNDSDIMIYSKYNEARPYEPWNAAYLFNTLLSENNMSANGATAFWKIAELESFVKYLNEFYNPPSLYLLQSFWAEYANKPIVNGGVCDMTALYLYSKGNMSRLKSLLEPSPSGRFDNNIKETNDHGSNTTFEMKDGFKKIIIKNKSAYVKIQGSNNFQKFHTLHFQGGTKKYIHRYTSFKISKALLAKKEIIIMMKNLVKKLNY